MVSCIACFCLIAFVPSTLKSCISTIVAKMSWYILHAIIEKFHMPSNSKCLMSNSIAIGREGVYLRCKGENSKRSMFVVII